MRHGYCTVPYCTALPLYCTVLCSTVLKLRHSCALTMCSGCKVSGRWQEFCQGSKRSAKAVEAVDS